MTTPYFGYEFDTSLFSEEESCPECGNVLYSDPQLCRTVTQDVEYEV